MILHGNQRGGARDLSRHLLSQENDHVDVYQLKGFVANDLQGALHEAYAMSKATKAKQFLYSMSLNPPQQANVSTKTFEDAIERAEKVLGLSGQPRAIVFHEKKGRRHCHVVWSRTNIKTMKAIALPHTKRKLMELSRNLYIEHGWEIPKGMLNPKHANKQNFTLAQWQQAKRLGKNPKKVEQDFQDAWIASDNQKSFAHALKSKGYILAKSNRRSFVAVNQQCEIFAIAKWVGIKSKEVNNKLGNSGTLPSVEQASDEIAQNTINRLSYLQDEQEKKVSERLTLIIEKCKALVSQQRIERQQLSLEHKQRELTESLIRQKRLRTGLRGLFDRITGARKRTIQQNQLEAEICQNRDRKERDNLIFKHLQERRTLEKRHVRLEGYRQSRRDILEIDIKNFKSLKMNRNDLPTLKPKH